MLSIGSCLSILKRIQGAQRIFWTVKLHGILQCTMPGFNTERYYNGGYNAIIRLSKPIEWTTPRVNPSANYGLRVMPTCQWRVIALLQVLTVREAVPVWGTLHFPRNFAVNLKLLSLTV